VRRFRISGFLLFCGANGCSVLIFPLAFLVYWRCLFLGVARFGCFGFACFSSFFSCMPVIVGGGRGYKGKLRFGGFPPVPMASGGCGNMNSRATSSAGIMPLIPSKRYSKH